jgi:hypothetical protein
MVLGSAGASGGARLIDFYDIKIAASVLSDHLIGFGFFEIGVVPRPNGTGNSAIDKIGSRALLDHLTGKHDAPHWISPDTKRALCLAWARVKRLRVGALRAPQAVSFLREAASIALDRLKERER